MNGFTIFAFVAVAIATVSAQDYQDYDAPAPRRPAPHRIQPGVSGPAVAKPTPVPILKQINRHNEDGSYTYGYEGADGSFKIETKANTGEVKGKYGYVDADGKLRVVEYGANKYGFQPSGEGITVAPPTLVDESTRKTGLQGSSAIEYDDGAYYAPEPVAPARAVQIRPQQQYVPRPRPAAPRPKPSFQDFTVPQESPIPQRAQISGAAPSGVVYAEQPRPARPAQSYAPIQFAPAPQPTRAYSAPAPVQQSRVYSAPAPAPQRFAPSHFASASPAPQREAVPIFEPAQQVHQQLDDFGFSQPQTRPAPRPAPQPVHYAPRPAAPSRQSQGNGGILDQLAKDYALPDGGAPALHDISFGYY